ncbi:MAG: XRE family transcriptional regulator [Proteobacteria bacterium]|nr:MAG: XRE family transcriptional regulator [Pseudomonadota bacterium]
MDVKTAINQRINEWLELDASRSFFQLARISGIAHPTLYRLVNGKNSPNLETAIRVTMAILPEEDAHDFIHAWYPVSNLLKVK